MIPPCYYSAVRIAALVILAVMLLIMVCQRSHAECYPSLHSARSAHRTAHITWSHGCFYAGHPHHERGVPASRRQDSVHDVRAAKAEPRQPPPSPVPQLVPSSSPVNDKLKITDTLTRAAVEPHPVQTVRMVHVPEFDVGADEPGDATFDQRFGRAYGSVSRPDLRIDMERNAALYRLREQAEGMRHAIEDLREVVRALEGSRP